MTSFRPSQWFERLFGFHENAKNVLDYIKPEKIDDNYQLTSKINNMSYNAGNFQVRYISSFKYLFDNPRKGGTLNIICGKGSWTTDFAKIDAFSMQYLPENDGATYQAASNFNCLEFVSHSQTAYSGVTNYVYDVTQGPYTALACPQSALFRNYFCEHTIEDKNGNKKIMHGQLEEQVNLLSKTPLTVLNGYVIVSSSDCDDKLSKFAWNDENNYAVGVHSYCDVLLTRDDNGDFKYVGKDNLPIPVPEPKPIHIPENKYTYKKQKKHGKEKKEQKQEKEEKEKILGDDDNEKAEQKQEKEEKEKIVENDDEENEEQKQEKIMGNDDDEKEEQKQEIDEDKKEEGKDDEPSEKVDQQEKRSRIANHVYAASFNFYGDAVCNDFTLSIVKNLQHAEYKATILSAWENSLKMEQEGRKGAKKLFLTLLGGGVFGNPHEIISEAIASCEELIIESGLEVYVVCYDQYASGTMVSALKPIVDKTKGSIIYVD